MPEQHCLLTKGITTVQTVLNKLVYRVVAFRQALYTSWVFDSCSPPNSSPLSHLKPFHFEYCPPTFRPHVSYCLLSPEGSSRPPLSGTFVVSWLLQALPVKRNVYTSKHESTHEREHAVFVFLVLASLTRYIPVPSISQRFLLFHFSLKLSNVPLCIHATVSSSLHLLMHMQSDCISWLLCIGQQWAWMAGISVVIGH